jgi:hypothetical protein
VRVATRLESSVAVPRTAVAEARYGASSERRVRFALKLMQPVRQKWWIVGACFVAAGVFARPGRADSSGKNPVAAQALYDEARKLVDAGNLEAACPKFKASYELDPGGGTLLNLADCYEKQGKVALAWTTFKEALVMAQRDGRNERIDFANQHIAKLEARLAHLNVSVASDVRVEGMTIQVDGSPLAEAAWGVALPVDPGKHVVRVDAPGKRPFEATVDAAAGSAEAKLTVPALADASSQGAGAVESGGVMASATTPSSGSSRTLGWVVGGVGVVGLGVGGFFGLRAVSRWNDRNDACKPTCTQTAKDAGDEAGTAATISTIGFGVGLVGVGVGAYLLLAGGGEKEQTQAATSRLRWEPVASKDGAGLLLRSTW